MTNSQVTAGSQMTTRGEKKVAPTNTISTTTATTATTTTTTGTPSPGHYTLHHVL